jgi:hypothetical protein
MRRVSRRYGLRIFADSGMAKPENEFPPCQRFLRKEIAEGVSVQVRSRRKAFSGFDRYQRHG